MARPLRYLPPDCPLVEVTCRTIHGRILLRPSRRLNELVLGVLARAARYYGMGVCAFVFLSNHCHLLLRPTSATQLARFMNYLNSNIAREAGRLHRWREKFWGRRYRPVPVSFEPEAQIARLRYLLEQGSKEGLVGRPQDWPGAFRPGAAPRYPLCGSTHRSRKSAGLSAVLKDGGKASMKRRGFERPTLGAYRRQGECCFR